MAKGVSSVPFALCRQPFSLKVGGEGRAGAKVYLQYFSDKENKLYGDPGPEFRDVNRS